MAEEPLNGGSRGGSGESRGGSGESRGGPGDEVHTLPDEGDRSVHMARRLERTAEEAGMGEEGKALLRAAHDLAMEPRRARLGQRDPAFLHPGRSALVLLLDVELADPEVLAAALLVESEDPAFRVPLDALRGRCPARAVALCAAVPPSGDARLAEELVSAEADARLVALAERLDHLRHAHLWSDLERRRRAHAEAAAVYHPVAERTNPVLARRFAWWLGMFGKRHLGPPG